MSKRNALQSIRFFCAVLIFLYHLPNYDYPYLDSISKHLFYLFFSPVTFFIILSGWALTYTYYEKVKNKTFNLKNYFRKRILRIYPIHIFTFLLSVPLILAWHQKIPLSVTLSNILLIHAFIPSPAFFLSYVQTSWFLSVLMFLYLIFPYILLILVRFDRIMKKYAVGLLFFLVLSLSLWVYLNNSADPDWYAHFFSPSERFVDFMVGICIYFIVKQIQDRIKGDRIFWTIIETTGVIILIATFRFAYLVPMKYLRDTYFILPWGFIVGIFALSKGVISDILSWKPFVVLGSISLEFFLIHILSVQFIYVMVSQIITMTSIQKGIVSFLVAIAGSFLAHYILLFLLHPSFRKIVGSKVSNST